MRRLLFAGVVLLVLVGAGMGFAALDGDVPLGGGDDSAASGPPDRGTATENDTEYAFEIERIDSCGRTCREVTATLTNEGSEPRRNVTVETTVYADDDAVWSGEEPVGRLGSGESHTTTQRVKIGYVGGLKIWRNDGNATVVTAVRSERGVQRFAERREVA